MNKLLSAFTLAALLCGCASSSVAPLPPPIENVPVTVSAQGDLRKAIIYAATRRRWVPSEIDATTIRCTLVQRSSRVVMDIKLLDATHYSMLPVESNISTRKFEQWRNNLQREIAKYAALRH